MSEFSSTSQEEYSNGKKIGFASFLLSNIHLLFSLILSHPFYFSYFLFFSPYIFKIISFISPLFVTTTLSVLTLISTLRTFPDSESLETQPSFLSSLFSSFLELKWYVNDEDSKSFEELEAYKMVVEACESENESVEITFVDKFCSHESKALTEKTQITIQPLKFKVPMDIEKEEEEEEESEKCEKKEEEEQKVKPKKPKSKVVHEQPTKQESKVHKVVVVGDYNDFPKLSDFVGEIEKKNEEINAKEEEEEDDVSLRSVGSMRKEKEWRRTLACKLFEERHNADVGQGMDQLWETYETETEKKQTEEEKKTKRSTMRSMMKTKSIEKKGVVVEEEEDDEYGIDEQKLCCLQALKFSTGKMHLGISKRPNLLKLSKAFKGIGRLYNATKHPKRA